MPRYIEVTTPRARQAHTCCECGDTISPGEHYERAHGIWDGEWDTFRTCRICTRIRKDLCPCGWLYGDLREVVQDCLEVEL